VVRILSKKRVQLAINTTSRSVNHSYIGKWIEMSIREFWDPIISQK